MWHLISIAVILCFAVFSQNTVEGCRCLPDKMPTPIYCRTKYLGLVKFTNTSMDASQRRQHYHFELIKDLTDFGETTRLSLSSAASIDDPMAGTSCQTMLTVNRTYIIGVQEDTTTKQPVFTPCTSYIQSWPYTGAESDTKLEEMKNKCGHKSN